MPNELPSLAELQGTYGSWNPDAYNQAKSNQDLAGMFQQQKLLQENTNTQKGIQEYNQNEAMNPMLLEQQGLVNTGKSQANQTGALQLQRDYALQGMRLQQDQVDAIQKLKESDFVAMEQHARQLLQDPSTRAQGEQILGATKEAYLLNQKLNRDKELEKMKADSAERVAQIHAQATRDAAGMRAGGTGKKASLADLTKLSPDKSSAGANAILSSGVNPYTSEPLSEVETQYLQALASGALQNFNATNAARFGAGIVPQVDSSGKVVIQNKTPPIVGNTPAQGQTKSGIKFRVLPE